MRSSRLAATSCSRFRSPSTISLDESLVRSSAVAKVSTSRIPDRFPPDEKELETPEEEVEAPRPVLPHGRSGPSVGAAHHDRVDEAKALRPAANEAKAHR